MEIKAEIIAVNGIANGRSTGFGNNPIMNMFRFHTISSKTFKTLHKRCYTL